MKIETRLLIVALGFLILNTGSVNYHIFKNKQAEVTFLSHIYGSTPTDKPILVMSDAKIENFTSSTGKEFRVYTKPQIEKLLDASPDNQVFYKTLDVTIFLGFVSVQVRSYRATNQADEIIHQIQGGGKYYGINLFGHWFLRSFGSYSVNY